MIRGIKVRHALCFFLNLVVISALYARSAYAFSIPERLVYDLTWTGIRAGTTTLEIRDESNSRRIVSTARSADWVSVFYTVEDRIETLLAKAPSPALVGLPQNYRVRIREGKHRRDKEIIFDHMKHRAFFIDHLGGERKDISIQGTMFDPLSSLYHVRTLKLEVGKSVFVDVIDSKKQWNVEVQVLRKERIRTKLGSFDTIVIKPLMKSEGIFNRRGDIYIWLTDDQRRIPVMVTTKVVVGSVTATLAGGEY